MTPPHDLFAEAPTKRRILDALADGGVLSAEMLCVSVYGGHQGQYRDRLRNLIQQMQPQLARVGWAIHGRKQLRQNSYRLVNTLME